MIIDVIFLILMVLACFKGLSKGLIVAVFSILAFIIGLAAALKLSAAVSVKLAGHMDSSKWLPVISFLLVFIAVAILINICGRLVQKTFELVMLGWINRLGGAALYMILYSMIMSIFLFYAAQIHFIKPETAAASAVYPYLEPLGPKVINALGAIIPWFSNMFGELKTFFSDKAPATGKSPG